MVTISDFLQCIIATVSSQYIMVIAIIAKLLATLQRILANSVGTLSIKLDYCLRRICVIVQFSFDC